MFFYSKKFDRLKCELEILNKGFGNLNRSKDLTIYFVTTDNEVKYTYNVGKYNGKSNISFEIDINELQGEYDIYIGIHSDNYYPIRLANDLWNSEVNANLIGDIEILR